MREGEKLRHFPLAKNYVALLKAYGISIDELLKRAKLPLDMFGRDNPCVTSEEYCRFMRVIEDIVPDQKIPILLATADHIETITPPLFGAYCSANAKECIKRIAQYKALIGAIIFDVTEHEKGMTINIEGEGNTTTHYVTFYCLNGFEYSLMFYRIGYTL